MNISYVKNKCLPGQLGKGKCFGTFGELLQGVLEDGQDFLVTFPINLFSNATFISNSEDLIVEPAYKKKSQKLAKMILEHFNLPQSGELYIESNLPIGKGFASSSADMVSTARSIEDCFGIEVPVPLLQHMMSQLETSDGVMYSGVVSFYNKRVELIEEFNYLPPLTIVGVDNGGEVNTSNFHKVVKDYSIEEKKRYTQMLAEITDALKDLDISRIAQISSESAHMNQKVNPSRVFDNVNAVCNVVGGLGVIKAHTGTYSGIILSVDDKYYEYKLKRSIELLQDLCGNVSIFHSLH
ncbi:kinase [Fictibacillus nanhaiensis]|uniref:GHMP family kinase ATP-binding protein n=1 Tax=Fictibacillus nanhaiensis TaxID=742169 RepID=UPI003C28D982